MVFVLRSQLRWRAQLLGCVKADLSEDGAWADVLLAVDGAIVAPKTQGLLACFMLPADANYMWLVLRRVFPAMTARAWIIAASIYASRASHKTMN